MLSLYGLKWNPFAPDVPTEALQVTPRLESFCWRVEQLAGEGGFALITGYEKQAVMQRASVSGHKNAGFLQRSFPLFTGMYHRLVRDVHTRRCTCRFWNCLPITQLG
jgi:hypothetical protein